MEIEKLKVNSNTSDLELRRKFNELVGGIESGEISGDSFHHYIVEDLNRNIICIYTTKNDNIQSVNDFINDLGEKYNSTLKKYPIDYIDNTSSILSLYVSLYFENEKVYATKYEIDIVNQTITKNIRFNFTSIVNFINKID